MIFYLPGGIIFIPRRLVFGLGIRLPDILYPADQRGQYPCDILRRCLYSITGTENSPRARIYQLNPQSCVTQPAL